MSETLSSRAVRCLGRLLAPVAVLACSTTAVPAEPARYEIDPEHLSVGFLVDHIGYGSVLGMFRKASGSFTFDEQTGALSDVRVVVDTGSVFTNHRKRDEHLRSADFLNSREYPEMVFTAARATRKGERSFEVVGELELLGSKRPLTLNATWNKSERYPFGHKAYTMGVSLRGSFKRSPYGMTYAVDNGWVGDEVQLIVELEALRQ